MPDTNDALTTAPRPHARYGVVTKVLVGLVLLCACMVGILLSTVLGWD
ncbi:MAG: hypothetical protein WCQ64_10070 [Acidobacteriota bacterium]